MKVLIAILILTSSVSHEALAAKQQKSHTNHDKVSRKIASPSDFKSVACGKIIKLGRPTLGDELLGNIGACYGSIPSVEGLELVFVSYRDDGFTEVFQAIPSEAAANSQKTQFLTVGYLNDGKFKLAKDKDKSTGELVLDSSGLPKKLVILNNLGQKQKDIRVKSFDTNLIPSDFQ